MVLNYSYSFPSLSLSRLIQCFLLLWSTVLCGFLFKNVFSVAHCDSQSEQTLLILFDCLILLLCCSKSSYLHLLLLMLSSLPRTHFQKVDLKRLLSCCTALRGVSWAGSLGTGLLLFHVWEDTPADQSQPRGGAIYWIQNCLFDCWRCNASF